MNFQKSVLTISIVLLIVSLIVFGSMIYTDKSVYPPVQAQCPDYWNSVSEGKGSSKCSNVKNLGKGTCPTNMNFNSGLWTGSNGLCNKKKWAEACDLTWDGVTNNPSACKDSENNEDALLNTHSNLNEQDKGGFSSIISM